MAAVWGALAVSTAELALTASAMPSLISQATGFVATALVTTQIFGVIAVPTAILASVASRTRLCQRALPATSQSLAIVVAVAFGVALYQLPLRSLSESQVDFRQTFLGLQSVAFVAIVTLVVLSYGLAEKQFAILGRRFPKALPARRCLACVWLLASAASLAAGHYVFAPVHLVTLAAGAGMAATAMSVIGCRLLLAPGGQSRQLGIAAFALGALLLQPLGAHPHARFHLFLAASTSGPIASHLRQLSDRDHDGAAPSWLGGADCDDSDPHRGPGQREIPSDGIDQDCRGGDAPPQATLPSPAFLADCAPAAERSLLLLTIDAMRTDALTPELMPALSQFSAGALRYDRAYAPSTMTIPSMGSVFSGRAVSDLYGSNALVGRDAQTDRTLAEILRAAGYSTLSVNWYPLNALSHRGFQSENPRVVDVQPTKGQLLAATITATTRQFISEASGPYFVWAHYPDAHAPHRLDDNAPVGYPVSADTAYERSLEYIDAQLAPLLKQLNQPAHRNTVSVITADHGEDLGDRARLGHSPYLFEDVIRVPLLVRVPGCAGRRIQQPVSLSWLAASLLQLTGQDGSLGRTQLPDSNKSQSPLVVSEEAPANLKSFKRAAMLGSLKLVTDVQNGGRALFDLDADPTESKNIYGVDGAKTDAIEAAYQAWLDRPLYPQQ